MARTPDPTERELAILKILWEEGEATVRTVYESLRDQLPIVQNTVQAFLRTMEDKGLVGHRTEGRTFVYFPRLAKEETEKSLLSGVLDRVFDGAIDQLVESAFSVRPPDAEELARLRELVEQHEQSGSRGGRRRR